MTSPRRPRGYVGRNHETIGSDLVAVLRALEHLAGKGATARLPRQVLGADEIGRLSRLDPGGWYPIEWLLQLTDTIDAKLGRFGLLKVGRTLFRLSHEERARQVAHCARDIVYSFDEMYHHANRGEQIGGWKVLAFDASRAELEKSTPHHCAMEEGILAQALSAVGAPAVVSQIECFREGAPVCRFQILAATKNVRWSP